MDMSRRQVLQWGLGTLAASTLLGKLGAQATAPATAPTSQPAGQKFILINDLHYDSQLCDGFFAALCGQMAATPGLTAMFLLGDLTDLAKPAQFAGLQRHLNQIKVPIHAIPGNHDYAGPVDCMAYDQAWPNMHNYIVRYGEWQFLLLDSCVGTTYQNVSASAATVAYVATAAQELDPKKPLVVLTHFPVGPKVTYRLVNAEELLAPLKEHMLRGIYGGHYHGYTLCDFMGTQAVTNRCCSRLRDNHDKTKAEGYWLCTARGDQFTREFESFAFAASTQPGTQPATQPKPHS
jgi:3',5'-cyclic AMP phosphodiesterase CpdA